MERYYEDVSYSRWVHRLNAIPVKCKRDALEGDDEIIPKYTWKKKSSRNNQDTLEKNEVKGDLFVR